jgi:hypothetical protein
VKNSLELSISPEKVAFIAQLAKRFDAKDEVTDTNVGSNPSDDMQAAVLEDHRDDPVLEEMRVFINGLSEDEQIDLVALAWLGRGDHGPLDWPAVRADAAHAHNERTARYLCGTPLLGDYLEEGLALLGRDTGIGGVPQ